MRQTWGEPGGGSGWGWNGRQESGAIVGTGKATVAPIKTPEGSASAM
jgi:hypothetical protein